MKLAVFCILFVGLWCFSQAAGTDPRMYKALFFNRKEEMLIEMSEHDDRSECTYCISACPTSSDSDVQRLLNDKISTTENSVFLRDVYEESILAKEMKINICAEPPIPQLVYNVEMKDFQVGYEMYYEEDERIELECSWYSDQRKVIDGEEIQEPKKPPSEDLIKIHQTTEDTKFEILPKANMAEADSPKKQLVFYWISILIISQPSTHQRTISFKKDTITENFKRVETIHTCENYYTGDGRKTLQDDESTPSSSPKKRRIPNGDYANGSPKRSTTVRTDSTITSEDRLVKTQILPMYMLHSMAARLATCIYLNFAFVWESIANQLLKSIDMFLYALYRHFPINIYVDFGEYSDAEEADQTASEHELFRKFPTPEVLFRVIHYFLNGIDYVAVIVIHNNPAANRQTEKICPGNELKGWRSIEAADGAFGLSYACRLTSELVEKFQYYEFGVYPQVRDLELSAFPCRLEEDKSEPCFVNVIDEIREKLDTIKKENFIKNSS